MSKVYALNFNLDEINVLLSGLSELKLKDGLPLLQRIQQQVQAQAAEQQEEPGLVQEPPDPEVEVVDDDEG